MKIEAQAAILIGGKSHRFGSDKAFMKIGDEIVSVCLYHLLSSVFSDICLVDSTSRKVPIPEAVIYHDRLPGLGPLGGLLAALENSNHPFTFILACDLPFINRRLIELLWNNCKNADVIVPINGNMIEPLVAFYHKNCIPEIEKALGNGNRKMDSFWAALSVNKVELNKVFSNAEIGHILSNINTKNDFKKALRSWS